MAQALTVYYDDMIGTVAGRLAAEVSAHGRIPKLEKPVPVVASGGSSRAGGFLPRLQTAIREATLPIGISEVRLAADPLHSTAKGALMAALLEIEPAAVAMGHAG